MIALPIDFHTSEGIGESIAFGDDLAEGGVVVCSDDCLILIGHLVYASKRVGVVAES